VRALVTGAAGLVGRHMMFELQFRGWDVAGVDIRRMPAPASAHIGGFVVADARDVFTGKLPELSEQVFDLVVHCAYHVGGRAMIDGQPQLLARNLELDAQMFDWALRTRQRAVVYFSSSAAYPIELQEQASAVAFGGETPFGKRWVSLTETMINLRHVKQPDARYGWAKLTGEQLATAAQLTGLRVHILRPFSGYGSDQDDTYPFPAIVQRILHGDLSVWGPPGQYRDWIHISDVVRGTLAVYDQDCRLPVNLCSGVGTEFGAFAVLVSQLAGIPATVEQVRYQRDKPTGVMVRVGDPTRMLGFYEPKISLERGIRLAIEVARA
jgi:nucleoside-diphosphate-sugar epimerase